MALHVRHNTTNSVQGRICLSMVSVVLCATVFLHADSISVSTPSKSKAASIYISPQTEQAQKQETTAPRMELCTLQPTAPDPVYVIDTEPMLPDTESPCIPLALNPVEGIDENSGEHLFFAVLTPQFEEVPSTQPRASAPETARTYTQPQYKNTPQPIYPQELKRRRISGSVRVRIHITPQGKPTAVDIISSAHPAFAQSAKQTILSSWLFHPAHNGTAPVSATVVTTVQFVL